MPTVDRDSSVDNLLAEQASLPPVNSHKRSKPRKLLQRFINRNYDEPVKIAGCLLKIRDNILGYRHLLQLEMSCLDRIRMGVAMVSGVHGRYSPMFHDAPIQPEYDSELDDARLAIHEWMTRPSIASAIEFMNWSVWLVFQGVNPIAVWFRHANSLRRFKQQTNNTSYVDGWFELCPTNESIENH